MIDDVIQYGGIYNYSLVITEDDTPTEIAKMIIDDLTAGFVVLDVTALKADGTEINGGRYAFTYLKDGTITINTVVTTFEDFPSVTVSVVADGDENISIVGTGITATEYNWLVRTQKLDQIIPELPA